MHAG
jgi:carboxypeptidase D